MTSSQNAARRLDALPRFNARLDKAAGRQTKSRHRAFFAYLLDALIKSALETARIRKRHVRQRIAGMEPWPVRGPSKQAAHLWLFYIHAVEQHKNATKNVWLLRRLREAV